MAFDASAACTTSCKIPTAAVDGTALGTARSTPIPTCELQLQAISHLPVPTLSRTQRQGMPAYGALCQSSVVQTIATIYGFQCGRAINSSAHRPKANETQRDRIAVQVQARKTQLGVRAEIRNNW